MSPIPDRVQKAEPGEVANCLLHLEVLQHADVNKFASDIVLPSSRLSTTLSTDSADKMSFGRPPTFSDFKVSPPERGSFPLDHDGECKDVMQAYMSCLKKNNNDNGACRQQSKAYLQCRMDKGLMDKDEMDNLGFKGVGDEQSKTHSEKTGDAAKSRSSDAYPSPTKSKSKSGYQGSKEMNENQISHDKKTGDAANSRSSDSYPTPMKGKAQPDYAGGSHGTGGEGVSNSPGYNASSQGVGGGSSNGGANLGGSRQV